MKSKHSVAITRVLKQCIQCGICVKECDFLSQYGDPKDLATIFQHKPASQTAFSCSLCGLCTAVCPKDVDPAELFLWQRQQTAQVYKEHTPLRRYEKMGSSKLLSWYGLPDQCDTIFFPGCALPGTRAGRVIQVVRELQQKIPRLGVLLDCCTKPSHDLGHKTYFHHQFKRIQAFLETKEITTVLVACPNCYRIFKEYAPQIKTQMIYEHLPPKVNNTPQDITVHDPCGVRFSPHIHQAVRSLLRESNSSISEMKHHGESTICCGEGGAVGFLKPHLAQGWTKKRSDEALGQKVITYCAGCSHFLGKEMDTSHILDFLFEPEKTMAGREKISSSPFTYIHRFRLKGQLKAILKPLNQGSLG